MGAAARQASPPLGGLVILKLFYYHLLQAANAHMIVDPFWGICPSTISSGRSSPIFILSFCFLGVFFATKQEV